MKESSEKLLNKKNRVKGLTSNNLILINLMYFNKIITSL